jgi:hypothetical protein
MNKIVWGLTDEGHSLDIFEVNPITRQIKLVLELKRTSPMSEEEALKYMNANYPPEGSAVRLAAESLGILRVKK